MKTAFVTGGTGFLGLNLVALLRREGWRVIAIRRASSNVAHLAPLGAELVECGLDDPDALSRAMPEAVDAVFHVAGDISWWREHEARQRRTNVDGTRHVVDAAIARKARRFVHTSSVAAYGIVERIDEQTVSNAASSGLSYLVTKWEAEQIVKRAAAERGLDAVVMNPGNIVGPYDSNGWARLFRLLKTGKLPGLPPGAGSWCHAPEVARAHVAAVTAGKRGENYLLGGADASYAEVGAIIAELLGKKPPRRVPAVVLRAVARLNDWRSRITHAEPDITPGNAKLVCSTWRIASDKAQRELGYAPVSLRAMLDDSFRWLTAEKLI